MGLLRLGFLANFLSHPVVSGFITASGLQIAAGQLGPVLGIRAEGESSSIWSRSLGANLGQTQSLHRGHRPRVARLPLLGSPRPQVPSAGPGAGRAAAGTLAKIGPAVALVATTLAVWGLALGEHGVRIVGTVPQGLPSLALPPLDLGLWTKILVPALLISIVGYVESISVALTLAAKRRQRIDPDQELIALGAANIGAAVSGGFPVTGGLSRSVVNFEAGAETPAAGAFTAIGIALVTLFLTPILFFLPKATLAATIVVAVLSLVDFRTLKRTFAYSRPTSPRWSQRSSSPCWRVSKPVSSWASDSRSSCTSTPPRGRTWPSWARSRGRRISAT